MLRATRLSRTSSYRDALAASALAFPPGIIWLRSLSGQCAGRFEGFVMGE
jgi:hypothetical protein